MHADHSANLTRELFRLTWEDGVLAAATLAWVLAPNAMPFFHLYTVAAMVLTLSLGATRGLWVGLSRAAAASFAILLAALYGPMRHMMGLELLSMSGCGAFAGLLGERQRKAREDLKRSFFDTLQVLARALAARDSYTQGHTLRTARYAAAIASEMNVDAATRVAVEQAGLLHDLGKIGTPDAVLRKTDSLTATEQVEMRRHPIVGGQILEGVAFLADAADLVRHHHEHYDGSGYPDGLSGADIPIGARILAVADALDAMTTDRPYHKAMALSEAVREVERNAGKQFDPMVSDALKRVRL